MLMKSDFTWTGRASAEEAAGAIETRAGGAGAAASPDCSVAGPSGRCDNDPIGCGARTSQMCIPTAAASNRTARPSRGPKGAPPSARISGGVESFDESDERLSDASIDSPFTPGRCTTGDGFQCKGRTVTMQTAHHRICRYDQHFPRPLPYSRVRRNQFFREVGHLAAVCRAHDHPTRTSGS